MSYPDYGNYSAYSDYADSHTPSQNQDSELLKAFRNLFNETPSNSGSHTPSTDHDSELMRNVKSWFGAEDDTTKPKAISKPNIPSLPAVTQAQQTQTLEQQIEAINELLKQIASLEAERMN